MEEMLSWETEKCVRNWTWQLFENAALDKVTLSNAAQFNPCLRRPEGSPLQTIQDIQFQKVEKVQPRLQNPDETLLEEKDWDTNDEIKELLEKIFHTDATFDALCTLLPAQLNSLPPPCSPLRPICPPPLPVPASKSLIGWWPQLFSSKRDSPFFPAWRHNFFFFSFYPYSSGAPGVWEGKQGGGFNE